MLLARRLSTKHVPHDSHLLEPHSAYMRHRNGAIEAIFAVHGISTECMSDPEKAAEHGRIQSLYRSLAMRASVTATSWLVHHEADDNDLPRLMESQPATRRINDAVRRSLIGERRLWLNRLFAGFAVKSAATSETTKEDVEELDRACGVLQADLGHDYGLRLLGLRQYGDLLYSEPAEAMGLVLTGVRRTVPLPAGRLGRAIVPDDLTFRRDGVIEILLPGQKVYAAALGLSVYPAPKTRADMMDVLLHAPYRHSVGQCLTTMWLDEGQRLLTRQSNQLVSSNDPAYNQKDDLADAAKDLQNREFALGTHNLTMLVFADGESQLDRSLQVADRDLRSTGAIVSQLRWDLESAYFGMLGGTGSLHRRAVPITTRNFASFAPLHGSRRGHRPGAWCDHIGLFTTRTGEPFFWNPHIDSEGEPGESPHLLLTGPNRSGKAQPLDAGVLTPTGWRRMGDIEVGSLVTTPDGSHAKVLGVFPQGEKPIFRVTFDDGRSVECCDDHLWKVWDSNSERTIGGKRKGGDWKVMPLSRIREILCRGTSSSRQLAVPLIDACAIDHPPKDLPIPPYFLGALLGDGSFRDACAKITTADPEHILGRISVEAPEYEAAAVPGSDIDYRIRMRDRLMTSTQNGKPSIMSTILANGGVSMPARQWAAELQINEQVISDRIRRGWTNAEVLGFKRGKRGQSLDIQHEGNGRPLSELAKEHGLPAGLLKVRLNRGWPLDQALGLVKREKWHRPRSPLQSALHKLGLSKKHSYDKHVPEIYKGASVTQRLALIQGLLDTDGSVENGTHATFTSTSRRLALDVQEIAWSLGAIAKMRSRQTFFSDKHGARKPGRPSWRVTIVHPDIGQMFSLPRKVNQCRPWTFRQYRLRITGIDSVGSKPAQCIAIDHSSMLYVTNNYVVTHNTTLQQMLLLNAMSRANATVLHWGKDRDAFYLALRHGGPFFSFKPGEQTGLNPLKALSCDDPTDMEFLRGLVRAQMTEIAHAAGKHLSEQSFGRLDLALRVLMRAPRSIRSYGGLAAALDEDGEFLRPWCKGGALGWVLDSDDDLIQFGGTINVFDQTHYIDHEIAAGPIQSYLMYRGRRLADGRRLIMSADEFWKGLKLKSFRELTFDGLKTFPKKNAAMWLSMQMVADALRIEGVGETLRTQCLTQMHFPDGAASWEDYGPNGLCIPERPFWWITAGLIGGGKGNFMLKQGCKYTPLRLSLEGDALDDIRAELSARDQSLSIMDELIARHGMADRDKLFAEFHQLRKERIKCPEPIAAI